MVDQTQGEVKAETPAQDTPLSESQEQVVDQPQTQTQVPETETVNDKAGEVPKDNAAWAAMRTENKRLKEVIESVDPTYLERLKGAVAPQEYPQNQVPQVTGDAEYQQVTQGVNFANQQANRALQEASKLRNQLELQQDREAERAFPELKSDKVFQQIVAEKKLAARVLGHDRTTYEIAEEVSRLLGKRDEQVVARTAEETKDQMLQAKAISSEPKGQTTAGKPTGDNDELRMRVRHGDSKAEEEVAKRIIGDLEF
jgi:hypothetical protein